MADRVKSIAGIAQRITNSRTARFVRSAPLTFTWLSILLVTTVIQHSVPEHRLAMILGERSTNITHLSEDPVRVMITSLLWLAGYYWLPYLVLFIIFLAPAERWLGPYLWAGVGLCAHVLATLISEGVLYWAIKHGHAPESLINVQDIGVSYFLAGIIGVLTYRIAYPWRWVYAAGVISFFVVPLLEKLTFTAIGHLSALLIGMACYPLIRRHRDHPWNPADAPGQWLRSHRILAKN